MKRLVLVASALLLLCAPAMQAFALDFNFNIAFTADNVIDFWSVEYDDSTEEDLTINNDGNWNDWRTASIYNVQTTGSELYSFIWEIENSGNPGSGNPGGFLASIHDNGGTDPVEFAQGGFDTSDSWLVSLDGSNWFAASEYGANSDGSTIWHGNNGGPVAGITDTAQWIWADTNFSDSPDHVYVRVDIGQQPVPEPGTMVLLGLGLLGMLGWKKRRSM